MVTKHIIQDNIQGCNNPLAIVIGIYQQRGHQEQQQGYDAPFDKINSFSLTKKEIKCNGNPKKQ